MESRIAVVVGALLLVSGCSGSGPLAFAGVSALRMSADDSPASDPNGAGFEAAKASATDDPLSEKCPTGMALVEGQYCPSVEQECLQWLDDPARYSYARCAEYAPLSVCVAPREQRRYCIDLHEYTPNGETLPLAGVSWTQAKGLCEAEEKRLCTEAEWQFACEGEGARPYPYGYRRDSSACNFDRTDLYERDGTLRDEREPSGSRPTCVSPFGVFDMVGNVDEWTVREGGAYPFRSSLRGGWWMPARNRCRAATTAHNELYSGPQTGFRCCALPG
jgi:formylglycine-generating enzyme